MYDELVKMLRVCGDSNNTCGNCPLLEDGSCPHGEWEFAAEKYMLEAADAIEELSHSVDLLGDANKSLMDAAPEWISVEERLPGKYHQVLCYGKNGISVDYYSGETSVLGRPLFMVSEARVSHWMPLPEPPKEDEPLRET